MRLLEGEKERWEVTAKVDIPGQKPWICRRTYQLLPRASVRFDEFKRKAERYMARNCPTH